MCWSRGIWAHMSVMSTSRPAMTLRRRARRGGGLHRLPQPAAARGIAASSAPCARPCVYHDRRGLRYEGKPYRRLRVDAMAEEKLTRAEKAHLRLIRRVRRALEEEAVASLARAKRGHDALEAFFEIGTEGVR